MPKPLGKTRVGVAASSRPGPRRVLVLAYFFPPLGGAGVQRSLKFVRYLPGHGWQPTVITTRSRAYPAHDESLLDEVPAGVRVVRVREIRLLPRVAVVLHQLRLKPLYWIASWPDEAGTWAVGALLAAWREARRSAPAAIFSTSAPFSAHLAALALHRLTGIPWVADFRDEWAENPAVGAQPAWRRRLNRACERAITRHASCVVVAADAYSIDGAPRDGARRTTITNGVDPADLDGAVAVRLGAGRFRISHVGTLYGPQDLAEVTAALTRLVNSGAMDPREVVLRVVGNVWLRDLAGAVPVELEQTGYVEHPRALGEMRAADVLLLYVDPESRATAGKLFEYLASERPILCVTRPDTLAWELVSAWGTGICVDPRDGPGLDAALGELYERWRRGEPAPAGARARVIERYSRDALTGRLAGVLDTAADARR
jgi:glycosyltransferase involved in cell wall biosynthesis